MVTNKQDDSGIVNNLVDRSIVTNFRMTAVSSTISLTGVLSPTNRMTAVSSTEQVDRSTCGIVNRFNQTDCLVVVNGTCGDVKLGGNTL